MINIRGRRCLIAGLISAAVALAACDSGSSGNDSNTGGSGNGSLTVLQTVALQGLSPQPNTTDTYAFRNALYDPLVRLDDNSKPTPALATSWDMSSDNRTLVMHLRDDVLFHDGTPFDADAAVWNLKWDQDPDTGAQGAGQIADMSVSKVDDHTIKLEFKSPKPQIFALLMNFQIIKPDSDPEKDAIGTGPFKLTKYVAGSEIDMAANDKYWNGAPKLDSLTIKIVPDAGSAVIALSSGGGKYYPFVAPAQDKAVKGTSGVETQSAPFQGNLDLLINVTNDALKDKRVRQALGLAFDRERFVSSALNGNGQAMYTIWSPGSPAYSSSENTGAFDLDKAKALLTEAGVTDGLQIEVQTDSASRPALTTFLPIYQQDLAKIGVKLDIKVLERNLYVQNIIDAKFPGMAAHLYGSANTDPAILFTTFPFRPDKNASQFESADYASLIETGATATTEAERLAAYKQIDQLVRDEAFVLPIANVSNVYAYSSNVQGVALDHMGMPLYDAISIGS